VSVLWTYKYFMIFWISIQKEYALHPTTMRKPHFAQAFLPRDFMGGFFSLATAFRENTFCTSSENWSSLGYKKWFLWIRGAISQVQIAYLFLSLFCNEPTWLAYHHKKKLKAWRLLKIECSIWKYYSSPLNWPIFIGESRTTFAISYQIKLRCYWKHIRNKGNL
jgi:hypothetical protein